MWLSHGVWGDGFPSLCEIGVIYPTGRKSFSWVKIDRYVAISKNDLDKPYELENDDRLLDSLLRTKTMFYDSITKSNLASL